MGTMRQRYLWYLFLMSVMIGSSSGHKCYLCSDMDDTIPCTGNGKETECIHGGDGHIGEGLPDPDAKGGNAPLSAVTGEEGLVQSVLNSTQPTHEHFKPAEPGTGPWFCITRMEVNKVTTKGCTDRLNIKEGCVNGNEPSIQDCYCKGDLCNGRAGGLRSMLVLGIGAAIFSYFVGNIMA